MVWSVYDGNTPTGCPSQKAALMVVLPTLFCFLSSALQRSIHTEQIARLLAFLRVDYFGAVGRYCTGIV
jgi:hypothetical protein